MTTQASRLVVVGVDGSTGSRMAVDEAAREAARLLAEQLAGWPARYPDVRVEQRPGRSRRPVARFGQPGPWCTTRTARWPWFTRRGEDR
jgi:hypothetical protein